MPDYRLTLAGLRWPQGLTISVVTSSLVACQLVFGDFEFQPVDQGGSGGTTGGSTATTPVDESCDPLSASRRCSGSQPQACQNGVWTNDGAACTTELPCLSASGVCAPCVAKRMRCSADWTGVEICRDDSSGWELLSSCASPTFCDTSALACVVCQFGENHCVDSKSIQKCRGDQSGFETVGCSSGPCITVGGGKDYCQKCDPNQIAVCTTGNVLVECTLDQTFLYTQCPGVCFQINNVTSGYCK